MYGEKEISSGVEVVVVVLVFVDAQSKSAEQTLSGCGLTAVDESIHLGGGDSS